MEDTEGSIEYLRITMIHIVTCHILAVVLFAEQWLLKLKDLTYFKSCHRQFIFKLLAVIHFAAGNRYTVVNSTTVSFGL